MSDHLRGWLAATSAEERERVAREAKTSVAHLWQLAGGHRKASPSLAERLQDASGGQITIAGLRPDLVGFAEKSCAPQSMRPQPSSPQAPPTLSPFCRPNPASGSALIPLFRHPVPRWPRELAYVAGQGDLEACQANQFRMLNRHGPNH